MGPKPARSLKEGSPFVSVFVCVCVCVCVCVYPVQACCVSQLRGPSAALWSPRHVSLLIGSWAQLATHRAQDKDTQPSQLLLTALVSHIAVSTTVHGCMTHTGSPGWHGSTDLLCFFPQPTQQSMSGLTYSLGVLAIVFTGPLCQSLSVTWSRHCLPACIGRVSCHGRPHTHPQTAAQHHRWTISTACTRGTDCCRPVSGRHTDRGDVSCARR